MKGVLIEVFKRNKCNYTNVLTLLNLFQRGEELVSMTYKKREYDQFFHKRRVGYGILGDEIKNEIEDLLNNKTQNIINNDEKIL